MEVGGGRKGRTFPLQDTRIVTVPAESLFGPNGVREAKKKKMNE